MENIFIKPWNLHSHEDNMVNISWRALPAFRGKFCRLHGGTKCTSRCDKHCANSTILNRHSLLREGHRIQQGSTDRPLAMTCNKRSSFWVMPSHFIDQLRSPTHQLCDTLHPMDYMYARISHSFSRNVGTLLRTYSGSIRSHHTTVAVPAMRN